MMEVTPVAPSEFDRLGKRALIVGVAGLALSALWAIFNAEQFFRSYLLAYVFWIGIVLGCFAILMVQHMSGGAWGLVIRRVLEAATRTFLPMAALFIPLAIGVMLKFIYVWANPEAAAGNATLAALLKHKEPYLNVPFFLARVVFYFVVWIGVTHFLNKWSLDQDRTGDRRITRKMQVLSGPGLVLYGLTVTFASIDWVMSLEPEWFSTIFGILFMGGQGVAAMAFIIAVMVLLNKRKPFSEIIAPRHFHDLGKLLLAFIMLWAYFNFSQFLIIWSGNLPEEIPWYIRRLQGPFKWIGLILVIFHFALPFLMLLSRNLKRDGRRLAALAIAVIIFRLVDVYWLIAPEFHHGQFHLHLLDILAPIGLGGVWLWLFFQQLKKRPLLPVGDPELEGAIGPGEGHH
ncbi:MAG TPA: hypothetical protein VKA70_02935 [Blastocatellia bacterium]|nr:hypothetical protein [Blastocatellia bacterium]